jgi:hypothetical protein
MPLWVVSALDRLLLSYEPLQSPSAHFLRNMMGVPGWAVGPARLEDPALTVSGWAVSPRATDSRPTLLVNRRKIDSVDWHPRPDVDRLFWFVPEVRRYGFTARYATGEIDANHDVIEMAASWLMKDGQVCRLPSFFLRCPGADLLPLPDDKRRMRVHGDADESAFRLIGSTRAGQLDAVLRQVLNRPLNSFRRILD